MRSESSTLAALFAERGSASLVADGTAHTAAALHAGAQSWSRALARSGIGAGNRVLSALPNGVAFASLVSATLASGITLIPVPEGEDLAALLQPLDARLGVTMTASHPHLVMPTSDGSAPCVLMQTRDSVVRSEGIAFLLRTSGTTAAPRFVALRDTGVLAMLRSHVPRMAIDDRSVLSVLPWHHAFGLVLDLLPALLHARRIVPAGSAARDAVALRTLASAHAIDHLSMVPLIASRLAATADGLAFLRSLGGGLIGGAPIDGRLAEIMSQTRLRIGYGQTEASPGIMLSEPGEFAEALLGRPIGCDVRIEQDEVLSFRGPNACAGVWADGALEALDADAWRRTGDIVSQRDGVYTYIGRTSMTFKLSNGRMVSAPHLEAAIRRAVPNVTDVVLTPQSGALFEVLYSTLDARPVSDTLFRTLLGGLAEYFGRAIRIDAEQWVRTPKGDIDRRRLPVTR